MVYHDILQMILIKETIEQFQTVYKQYAKYEQDKTKDKYDELIKFFKHSEGKSFSPCI